MEVEVPYSFHIHKFNEEEEMSFLHLALQDGEVLVLLRSLVHPREAAYDRLRIQRRIRIIGVRIAFRVILHEDESRSACTERSDRLLEAAPVAERDVGAL